MNNFIDQIESFVLGLDFISGGMLVLVFILLAIALWSLGRMLTLSEENEHLKRDYTPRRKRVYQEYINWLRTAYASGSLELSTEHQESLRQLFFDMTLWADSAVIKQFQTLQKMLISPKEMGPEAFEKVLFRLLISMRKDMGLRTNGLKWKRLQALVTLPKTEA